MLSTYFQDVSVHVCVCVWWWWWWKAREKLDYRGKGGSHLRLAWQKYP